MALSFYDDPKYSYILESSNSLPPPPPAPPLVPSSFSSNSSSDVSHLLSLGLKFSELFSDFVISHPFRVLRHQSQVNHIGSSFLVSPISVVPSIHHLYRSQGLKAFWKGFGSSLILRGLSEGANDTFIKINPLSLRPESFCSALASKVFVSALLTPFSSIALIESVQSDIASETPGVFDIFTEGFHRYLRFSKGRRNLPLRNLIPITVLSSILHFTLKTIVERLYGFFYKIYFSRNYGAVSKIRDEKHEMYSRLLGSFLSESLLYPLTTIVIRLHLQGSRTLFDNLDRSLSCEVLPITTNYVGVLDCWNNIIREEGGPLGFFKGFPFLLCQFASIFLFLQFSIWSCKEIKRRMMRISESSKSENTLSRRSSLPYVLTS